MATLPPSVAQLLDALLADIRGTLVDNFVGAYLCGSLATGDFDPATSDVDLLFVTAETVFDAQLTSLGALHTRIPVDENDFGQPYEVYYIDRQTLKRFKPGRRHVKAGLDEEFGWKAHRQNWVIERAVVREHGVIISGPDPRTLIDPVTQDETREAARAELAIRVDDWANEWKGSVNPAPWIEKLGAQSFEVVTVCRALITVEHGDLPSKPQAFAWGRANLPEEWRSLVQWAHKHRDDKTRSTDMVPEVIRFVQWAAAEATQ
ncbi:MAG TPA: aminoglycoside adenylyltransferase domain-containing protein [Dehalococcoidia bacterium]|nr:aminoglycoside adenylyltransferase domain-containing protein [Dehalococcoidia bacterium]